MFIGHYGPSFIAKARAKELPLWLLFLAVQIVDVGWCILVLLGVEKVRVVPGITKSLPLDLYYMPYTHSLVAALLWSAAAFVIYRAFRPSGARAAAVVLGLAVLSHWVLDLVVHRPDLPLYDDTLKVGLGLWNYPAVAFLLEAALFLGGVWIYFRSTTPVTAGGRYAAVVFGVALCLFQAAVFFGPPAPSPQAAAVMFLVSYFVIALAAAWIERKRV